MIYFWILLGLFVCLSIGAILFGLPYVPTLKRDLNKLLDELKIGKNDHLVDLGAGDGRIMLAAAQRGARVSGVEINPFLVLIARWRLRKFKNTKLKVGDLFKYTIPSDATHVFLFTNGRFMNKLEPKLTEIKGLTVISYGFGFYERQVSREIGPFFIYEF